MCVLLGAATAARTLTGPEAFEADRDHDTECEVPYVYMPEHRWRVEEPSAGGLAGNVRAVFEDMSQTILVGDGPQQQRTAVVVVHSCTRAVCCLRWG